jgi:dTDP-4-dehydrorhamnose reductase
VDKKFVNKVIEKINRGDTNIRVADDCVGSPTYNIDFAEAIKYIINTGQYGIYHAPNKSKGVSRYEFAQEVVKAMGVEDKVHIVPCKIDDLKEEFPCKRTNYEVIEPSIETRDWKEALKGYINAHYRH